MRVKLIAVGTRMPAWVEAGVDEYQRRLPPELSFQIIEIPLAQRGKNTDIPRAIAKEGEAMLAALGPRDHVIALEVGGKAWSTPHLANQLEQWMQSGDDIALLVGGPDGLAPTCRARASSQWSLSALTLPHPMVRIILAEQIYRAWSILRHHPYHR